MLMMIIPNQLKNEKFIHCSLEKKPIEKGWPSTSNYDYQTMSQKDISRYGVLCGNNNLIVVDCDARIVQEKLMQIEQIRNTFIVQTAGKQLYHFYFHVTGTNNPKGFRIDSNKGERLFDVQGLGTMVVGPNTQFSHKKYEIVNPSEIVSIDYDFLCQILKNLIEHTEIVGDDDKRTPSTGFEFDEVCAAIKQRVTVDDLLPKESQGKSLTMCPLGHTSEGGKCFSHHGVVWKCFHCNRYGNIFHLYMKMHKCTFLVAKRELIKKAGLQDDFKLTILELYGAQKTRHIASEKLATEIVKLNNIYTIRGEKDVELWIYKEGIYIPHGKTYIKEFCRGILGALYKTRFVTLVIEKIISDTYIDASKFFINENVTKVAVLNGVLNIKTRELESFHPKYKFFNKLPVYYDPLIEPNQIIKFFEDILIDKNDVQVVQELFGYLLWREYTFEKAFMFLGRGRNGKGKLISLMEKFLGKANCCNVPLQKLGSDKFIKSRLFNKMANLSADLNKTGLQDTGTFKSMTGRDLITADRKFLDPIEFRNYAKMIFATNELPYTYDETDGFWDRWIIIDFVFKFTDEPNSDKQKPIDRDILAKISIDKEMIGLLNWALDGLDRLFINKRFSVSTSTEQIKSQWKRKASSFSAFLMDCMETDYASSSFISTNSLNNQYSIYCQKHKVQPESPKSKSFHLTQFGAFEKRHTIDGMQQRGWSGLKFKDEEFLDVEINEI